MKDTVLKTWPIFFGIATMMVANGLQGTLIGVRATIEDFSLSLIGIILSAYYVGYLVGSYYIPRMIASVGHIRVFAGLASLASITILLQGLFIDPLSWIILRVLSGFSFVGLFLVVESWLNDATDNNTRGKILGMYLLMTYGGMAVGQVFFGLADPATVTLFMVIAIFVSASLLPLALIKRPTPNFEVVDTIRLSTIWKRSPLGILGVTLAGVTTAAIFAIAPVYALELGLSNAQVSILMISFLIGSVVCQMPVAYLSDRYDRRKIIIILSFLSLASSIALLFAPSFSPVYLYAVLAVMGGASLPIYGQSVSHVNDHLTPRQFVAASATILLINGAGAAVGPMVTTWIMMIAPVNGFAVFLIVNFAALSVFGVYRTTRREPVPLKHQGEAILMPARGSSLHLYVDDTP